MKMKQMHCVSAPCDEFIIASVLQEEWKASLKAGIMLFSLSQTQCVLRKRKDPQGLEALLTCFGKTLKFGKYQRLVSMKEVIILDLRKQQVKLAGDMNVSE